MTGVRAPVPRRGFGRASVHCDCRCVHRIRFAKSLAKGLRGYDRKKILDTIERQLSAGPGVATRHRKILVGLVPPFDAVPPIWQLAVGEFRVFYDVNENDKTVVVRDSGHRSWRS